MPESQQTTLTPPLAMSGGIDVGSVDHVPRLKLGELHLVLSERTLGSGGQTFSDLQL